MTGLLGLAIPPYIKWIGYGVAAIAAASAGAYVDHKLMDGKVARAQAETATVQAAYEGYKGRVQADAARANMEALAKQNALQGALNASLAEAQKQKGLADARSQQLQDILNHAAPQDVRPIGPVADSYYRSLRSQ